MTFVNSRGRRANIGQILQERQAQREGIDPNLFVSTLSAREAPRAVDPWGTYMGITTTTYSTATFTPTGYYNGYASGYQNAREAPRSPRIIPHRDRFSAIDHNVHRNYSPRAGTTRISMATHRACLSELTPHRLSQLYLQIGQSSRLQAKKRKELYKKVMIMGVEWNGKTFRYLVSSDSTKAQWLMEGTPVVKVDLTAGRIHSLTLPKGWISSQINKVRFLWRLLGFDAVRYKDHTVVKTELGGCIMSPGDTWIIPEGEIKPFMKPVIRNTQLELFE